MVKGKICLENLPSRTMNRGNFSSFFFSLSFSLLRKKGEKKKNCFRFYRHFNILTMMWPILSPSSLKFAIVASRLTFNIQLWVSLQFFDIYHISKSNKKPRQASSERGRRDSAYLKCQRKFSESLSWNCWNRTRNIKTIIPRRIFYFYWPSRFLMDVFKVFGVQTKVEFSPVNIV